MSTPLSYQSTRCVLQYFNSTERFLFTSRCPTIKQFEKSIPLRLENLKLTKDGIILNDLRFRLNEAVSVKRAGRGEVISSTSFYSVTFSQRDGRMMSGWRTIAPCTTRMQLSKDKAMEKLACILLGGRNTVFVERMEIQDGYPEGIEWPANFQIAVDRLVAEHHNFEYILPIVSDASPLKYLDSQFSKMETFDNKFVKGAKELYITNIHESCYPILATLRNKDTSFLDLSLPKEVIISIVKNWIEEGRQIGTSFFIRYDEEDEEDEEDILESLKNRFEGRYATKVLSRDNDQLNVSLSSSARIVFRKGLPMSLTVEAVHE